MAPALNNTMRPGAPGWAAALALEPAGRGAGRSRDACCDGLAGKFAALGPQDSAAKEKQAEDEEGRGAVPRFRLLVCTLALSCCGLAVAARLLFNLAVVEMASSSPEAGWNSQSMNGALAAFYIGYAPSMLLTGGIADRYGARWPLLVCLAGSALVNWLTPRLSRLGPGPLGASRIVLGVLQGCLVPALYNLFNRWLTPAELAVFAPLLKVAMGAGMLLGTALPGLASLMDWGWESAFYMGGASCALLALAWALLAQSGPESSSRLSPGELQHIRRQQLAPKGEPAAHQRQDADQDEDGGTPWLSIATNRSVAVLALAKFTYNLGMDFVVLELALYLREVHEAPSELVSLLASAGFALQMALVAPVSLLARSLVHRRAWGLSRTKWRKAFQAAANLGSAALYVLLSFSTGSLAASCALLLAVCVAWTLGAGGEAMLPYDLSARYPATIMGLTHSLAITSGLALPLCCALVLGDGPRDPERWRLVFLAIGSAQTLGGLAFVLLIKAKPFLAAERAR